MKPIGWIVRLETVVALCGLLAVTLVLYAGQRIMTIHSQDRPLLQISRDIRLNLSTAHIWLEEALAGDPTVDTQAQVIEPIAGVLALCRSLHDGGSTTPGPVEPVSGETVRAALGALCQGIEAFQALSHRRLSDPTHSGAGSALDDDFDALYVRLIQEADRADALLSEVIAHDQQRISYINHVAAALLLALFIAMAVVICRANRAIGGRDQALTERARLSRDLQLLLESTGEGIFGVDGRGHCSFINQAGARLLGSTPEQIIGQPMHALMHHSHADGSAYSEQDCAIYQAFREGREVRISNEMFWRIDGAAFPVEYTASPIYEGERISGAVVAFTDITERKWTEQRLNFLSNFDSLTGLPNRRLLMDRLKQTASRCRRRGLQFALLYLDLDNFKHVNETLGHATGDHLLQQVVGRIQERLRDGDTLARFSGDEFIIVLEGVQDENETAEITQRLIDAFDQPLQVDRHEIFITVSIGITLFPSDDDHIEHLLRDAHTATHRAKDLGRNNYQFFTADMNARALERLALESNLRHALERGQFVLHYQPQIDLASGEAIGVECLLRWIHPELGMISPVQFIPLLEHTGMIIPVGDWVLRTACTQARAWQAQGLGGLRISVNLSARQFAQRNLAERVGAILAETGLSPGDLDLELTESIIMENAQSTIAILEELKRTGVLLSVDDFGTGYSSLSYLKRFPIDVLKIDRSFIRDIPADTEDAAIAAAIINLAHSLEIKVIAEGVETAAQLQFLRDNGCDGIQGYYYSPPRPAEEIPALVRGKRLRQTG